MKLFEYEAKQIISNYNIEIPKNILIKNENFSIKQIEDLNLPLVIKSQILISGRQKAGGILFANSNAQTFESINLLFRKKIKNEIVTSVLVEEKIEFIKEIFLGITIDRNLRSYVALISSSGGIDVESNFTKFPNEMTRIAINSQRGIDLNELKKVLSRLGYYGSKLNSLISILNNLFQIVLDYDLELIELNPIVETKKGNFVALDSRIILDDNSLFRHPIFKKKYYEKGREFKFQEINAKKLGLNYVKLDGDIGVIGNGAGLVLATIDLVKYFGGKPSVFLDLGGGASIKRISEALNFVLNDQNVKVVFVNIMGGLTQCDDVAAAIISILEKTRMKKPIITRLVGINQNKGKQMLAEKEIDVLDNMEIAAIKAVELSRMLN